MHVSRRSFFRGVGAGTAALFGGTFARQAFGQGVAPKRLIVLYMPNSNIRANWAPTGGRVVGGAGGDATQFSFGTANSMLAPAKPYLTLIDGLDQKNIGGDPHGSGIIRFMTGGTIVAGEKAGDPGAGSLGNGNLPVRPSIDQVLAGQSPMLKGPPIYSLQLAGDARADNGRTDIHMHVMSYDLKLTPMPPELQPTTTFTRLFSNIMSGGPSPAGQQAAMKTIAEQTSVLDYLKGDLNRLYLQLPADQRPKLDSHLSALREFERTLVLPSGGNTVTIPAPPPVVTPNVSANHPQIVSQYFDVIKLAFQLDLTRMVTFMFGSGNSQVVLPGIPGLTKGIHPTAHDYAMAPLTAATNWYCGVVAKLVTDLQAITDLDGSSMLDNTLIVMFSETGQFHEFANIPIALFGGSKLGLKGGRCLRYTGQGRTMADAWTGISAAFGVPMPTFGDAAYNMGVLPELFG